MKNLKVSMKLIVSFSIVIVLSVIVGVVGIIGMYNMNVGDDNLYYGNYLPTVMAGDISQIAVEQRVALLKFIVYDAVEDAQVFANAEADLADTEQRMRQLLADYDETIVLQEDRNAFNEFVALYDGDWKQLRNELHQYAKANDSERAKEVLGNGAAMVATLNELTTKLQEFNLSDGEATVVTNTAMFSAMTTIEVIVLIVAVAVAVFFALYVSRLISAPLKTLTSFMNIAGSTGNITLRPEDVEVIGKYAKAKDETGQCIGSTANFIKHITDISEELGSVAAGDLTTHIHVLSAEDVLGISVKKMVDNLNSMFGEINTATAQVSTGSKQIADGSQALAQGSTEQAAAVEQLSSSIAEIAQKTKDNAAMAEKAEALANTIKGNAEKGSLQMNEMMSAVKEINEASQSINKVIKVIDDIAFQTNILALNAAVEAARAGQHGKGFAVVAEEVRNLAAKSAEAAKDTGSLIANSMEKAELGARIADDTAMSLNEIVSGINESTKLVSDIAKSSDEQSAGITQINTGIDQVAQVVQQNSATAEESAAASEEMSGQSDMLQSLVAQFKIKDSNSFDRFIPAHAPVPSNRLAVPEKALHIPANEKDDYGKY